MKRRMNLHIFASPTGTRVADWSRRASRVEISEGEHGPLALTADIRLGRREAFRWFSDVRVLHVELLLGGSDKQWAGRLEDVAIVEDGIRITALGYWQALADLDETALWSSANVADWEPVLSSQWASAVKDRYVFDTNNRLFISPKKNQSVSNSVTGAIAFSGPNNGSRLLTALGFSYKLTFLGTDWMARCFATDDFVSFTILWTLTSAAGTLTGSSGAITFTGKRYVVFDLHYNNATPATTTANDGDTGLEITNLRVKSTTSSSLYGDEIARALVTQIRGVNPDQLSSSTLLIESPGRDITELVYEDATAAEILTDLAQRGDSQTPPRLWEVGVNVDRRLYLRPRGSAARDFYVSLADLQLERSLKSLANSVYVVHQDESNRAVRTAVSTDSLSVAQRGLTRRRAVNARTTSTSDATIQRDAALQDGKDPRPRVGITIRRLRTKQGALVPRSELRAGDRLTIQDLPPSLGESIDRIRTFYVSERRYRVDEDELAVVLESPLPQLEYLLATR